MDRISEIQSRYDGRRDAIVASFLSVKPPRLTPAWETWISAAWHDLRALEDDRTAEIKSWVM